METFPKSSFLSLFAILVPSFFFFKTAKRKETRLCYAFKKPIIFAFCRQILQADFY